MTKPGPSLLEYLSKNPAALQEEVVLIPEWNNAKITLRAWTAMERDDFEADNVRRSQAKAGNGATKRSAFTYDLHNFRARVLSRTIVENGVRTFLTPQGQELLGQQPAAILDRLFTVAQRLHGMTTEDVDKLTGESGATAEPEPSSALPHGSAEPSPN